MACQSPCFDCPFMRGSEKLKQDHEKLFEMMFKSFTEDGGFEEIQCEEQVDICFGQIQMLANGVPPGLDEFSDLGEAVSNTKSNWKEYFIGPWEFIPYHEA